MLVISINRTTCNTKNSPPPFKCFCVVFDQNLPFKSNNEWYFVKNGALIDLLLPWLKFLVVRVPVVDANILFPFVKIISKSKLEDAMKRKKHKTVEETLKKKKQKNRSNFISEAAKVKLIMILY